MLDLQYICDNQEAVTENCQNRGIEADIPSLVELRKKRNEQISQIDQVRHAQKETSGKIPKASAEDKPVLIQEGKKLREQIQEGEKVLKEIESQILEIQTIIPNMTHPDVPIDRKETGYVVLSTSGNIPDFGFEPLDHVALADKHELIDFESGARVAGHGFYYFKNEAVLLELALCQYALQILRDKGFTLYSTPDLARDDVLQGIGFNPRGNETQIYSVQNSDLSLVATAEITLGGAMKDQTVNQEDLPMKNAGISHCFRTEAGAHGKATRGIYRVHQFTKVEMFAFTAPTEEESNKVHAEILAIEEEIFQGLDIPYRVIDTCTGDLGGPAYRKFDLEAWMPGRGDEGSYGEITSASNCTDYQARRLNIRCRSKEQKGTKFVHTLNGTAVSIARAMISLLENHQQADGSILIPDVLHKWTGFTKIG